MKKRLLILPLLAGFALSSCSIQDLMFWKKKEEQPSGEQTPSASVTGVTISGAKTSLVLGETMQLTASVTVTGDAAKTVTWSTSAAAKATVSSSGLVTAKGLGDVTVTATSTVDSSKSASVTFKVVAPTWSSAAQEVFEGSFGIAPPAFTTPSGMSFTDDYYDYYGIILGSVSGNSLSEIVASIKGCGSYTYLGQNSDGDDVFTALCAENPDFEWYMLAYYYQSYTTVQIGLYPVEYEAWPSQIISQHLAALGYTFSLPSFSTEEEFAYSCYYSKLESGEDVIVIDAYGEKSTEEPEITSLDYLALLDSESYKVIPLDEGEYQVQALDKTHTLYVFDQDYEIDYDTWSVYYYPGFQVVVVPYQPDYELFVENDYEMLIVGESFDLSVVKGDDVDPEAVLSFASSDTTVATVSEVGHVEAVGKGTAVITVSYEDKASVTATVYVEETIPTGFSSEQLAEFDKIHGEGIVSVPFSKYMETVSFDEEDGVKVVGKEISHEILVSYYNAMIADGWSDAFEETYELSVEQGYYDTVEEAREALFAYYGGYAFVKEFEDTESGITYVVSAELYTIAYDAEEEEYYPDYTGELTLYVFDDFIYSYEDALASFSEVLGGLGYETLPDFPSELPASRFSIEADSYGAILTAYETIVDLDLLKTALEALDFTCELEEVPADEEEGTEAYSYLVCIALDGEFVMYAEYEDGTLELYVEKKASGYWAESEEDLYDGAEICLLVDGKGLGAKSGDYFLAVDAVDSSDYYDPDAEGLLHLFLEAVDGKDGVYYLKDDAGNYYGDSNKKIVTSTTPSGTGYEWTVEFDEDEYAIFTCGTGTELLYNTSAPRFKTYTSGMSNGSGYYVYVYEN